MILVVGLLALILARSYRLAVTSGSRAGGVVFSITLVVVVASMVMHLFLTYNHFVTFVLFLFAYLLNGERDRSLYLR